MSTDLETAKRFAYGIEAAARALNERIAAATSAVDGLVVELEVVELQQFSAAGPTPFVQADTKIRPSKLEVGA